MASRLNLLLLARGLPTLYVIFCTLWILAGAVDWQALLQIRIRLWPWGG
jgi:hypothetical protein